MTRSLAGRICLIAVTGVIAVAVVSWIAGSELIKPVNHQVLLPAGFTAASVSIPSAGHAVAGWWIDRGAGSPVVLLVHGVRADRLSMVSRAQLLTRHGFSALLIDLQAHGETPGDAITLGYREATDVVAARDWIRGQAPGRKIGVIGTSLGGASVLLAPQPSGFDAVVLESVYPRITDAVKDRLHIYLGPLAPLAAPLLLMQLEPRLHISPSALEPIRFIGKLGAPVLVAAGSKDRHTTLPESKELFAAAVEPKELWIVDGAAHEDLLSFDSKGYERTVVQFLERSLNPVALASIQNSATPGSASAGHQDGE